jgi:flagellar biosynthesis anti-sigma factor FlgM
MADPIRGVNPADAPGVAAVGGSGSQPAATPKPQVTPTAVDSADLTRAQAVLTTISQASASVSTVDPLRVGQLQEALNSGTYQADPQLIAEKIMEIEALLSSNNNLG